ncbi:MAG: hydrogenase formation protein HypD [Trueperaceae bacterium]|nr:hydrogenase formation protein HypD [Trueperaceae bacterium]
MKYVDEFRNPELIKKTCAEIKRRVDPTRTYRIMEICGGHTHAIYRFGLKDLLPETIEFVHGPGCPVCVLPMARLDEGLSLSENPDVILTAFGDMMRVPGTQGTLLEHKARGRDIRMVYSPLDALKLAETNPERQVIFFAIGFETTAPSTALTLKRARLLGLKNFTVFCNHVVIAPPLKALLDSPDMRLDAFIGPGHVSTVIGCKPYEFIARDYQKPVVVSGFEPLDLLQSVLMIVKQLNQEEARVENQYARAVSWEGNLAAQKAMAETFSLRPRFEWRGLGQIPQSAFAVSEAYSEWDSEKRFAIVKTRTTEPFRARCGEVLQGLIKPNDCPLFANDCHPEHPTGALMVSSEGACAAYYTYVHRQQGVFE